MANSLPSQRKGIALVADEHFATYKKGDVLTLESSPRPIAQKTLEAYGVTGSVSPGKFHQFNPNNQADVDLLAKHTPGSVLREGSIELEEMQIENAAPKA